MYVQRVVDMLLIQHRLDLMQRNDRGFMVDAAEIEIELADECRLRHRIRRENGSKIRERLGEPVSESAISGANIEDVRLLQLRYPEFLFEERDLIDGVEQVSTDSALAIERECVRAEKSVLGKGIQQPETILRLKIVGRKQMSYLRIVVLILPDVGVVTAKIQKRDTADVVCFPERMV